MLELESEIKLHTSRGPGRFRFEPFEAGDGVEVVAQNPDARFAGKAKLLKYYGTVLGRSTPGHSLGATFSIRSVLAGVGVTHTFPLHAPWVKAVSILEKAHVKGGRKRFKKARLSKAEAAALRPFNPEANVYRAEQQRR